MAVELSHDGKSAITNQLRPIVYNLGPALQHVSTTTDYQVVQ